LSYEITRLGVRDMIATDGTGYGMSQDCVIK